MNIQELIRMMETRLEIFLKYPYLLEADFIQGGIDELQYWISVLKSSLNTEQPTTGRME